MNVKPATKQPKNKAVLVTGATGFLGRLLVARLIGEGYHVTAIGHRSAVSPFGSTVEYMQVDLADVTPAMKSLVPWRWDVVINLAGSVASGAGTCPDSYSLVRSHIAIALNLSSCIPDQWRGPCIHASSMTVYGMPQYLPVDEHHPRVPLDGYGMAKALAEDVFLSWRGRYSGNCWVMRFPGLFSEDRHSGALHNFALSAYQEKALLLSAPRPTPWDILHVSDAAEAIMRALVADCHSPGPVNISYGEVVEIEQVAHLIVEMAHSKSEVQNPLNIRHPVFQMDISRARQLLNWPPFTLRQRLEQFCTDIASKVHAGDVA